MYKIQVTVIYSQAILVAVMSKEHCKEVLYVKHGMGSYAGTLANSVDPDQMPHNAIQDHFPSLHSDPIMIQTGTKSII